MRTLVLMVLHCSDMHCPILFTGHAIGESEYYKLLGGKRSYIWSKCFGSPSRSLNKLEAQSIRLQQSVDKVNTLNRKIERLELLYNIRQDEADVNRMFDNKFRELLKLQSHLQLEQDQLARKQDLLHYNRW